MNNFEMISPGSPKKEIKPPREQLIAGINDRINGMREHGALLPMVAELLQDMLEGASDGKTDQPRMEHQLLAYTNARLDAVKDIPDMTDRVSSIDEIRKEIVIIDSLVQAIKKVNE